VVLKIAERVSEREGGLGGVCMERDRDMKLLLNLSGNGTVTLKWLEGDASERVEANIGKVKE
jgi:hypothetical protein